MKAEDVIRVKELLPTSLGSDEIREQIAREILQRSIFSARMESARYLAKVRDVCAQIAAGEINQADARLKLVTLLEQMGHSPQDGGGITNPASIRRLNLVVDMQRQMAASVAVLSEQTEATVAMWPAWELTRLETRAVPRPDWDRRWAAAGLACGFKGALKDRFIALKSSPIWQELGNGAGGYRDTLGNPYPPFAFSSGLDWVEVDRDECIALGLVTEGEEVPAPSVASLSPGERDIAEAIDRYGFPNLAEGMA
ncbi:MAG: hypothetical protein IKZ22_02505, partial [Kiritimatiellae bacterium]|nr:hypothetical protein [Kiritimatiellia bacterium]